MDIEESENIVKYGIKTKDALHVSSAVAGKADYSITTDDKLLKKLSVIKEINSGNPVDIVGKIDKYDH